MKPSKKPLKVWAVCCASGEIHLFKREFMRPYPSENGARAACVALSKNWQRGYECGPHRIVVLTEEK